MKKLAAVLGTILALLVTGFLLVRMAANPISTDLSLAGAGTPTLVLGYENYSPTGGEALNRLRSIRPELESRLLFLVADLGTTQGRAFADRHGLADGLAVVLGPDGTQVLKLAIPPDEARLRQALETSLERIQRGG